MELPKGSNQLWFDSRRPLPNIDPLRLVELAPSGRSAAALVTFLIARLAPGGQNRATGRMGRARPAAAAAREEERT